MAVASPDHLPLPVTMDEIHQCLEAEHDPARVLSNIACTIGNRFGCDVCSIYRLSPDGRELILTATVGLHQDCVGHLRMRTDEGLTGLVAENAAPLLVRHASAHPRFKHFPEAGEDPYDLFFGVPIVSWGEVQGVLVVQTTEPRTFTQDESRLLVVAGRQLGAMMKQLRDVMPVEALALA